MQLGCTIALQFPTATYLISLIPPDPSFVWAFCSQMVLNTSRDSGDLTELMQFVYEEIFVECVIKHPLYKPGQPFQ